MTKLFRFTGFLALLATATAFAASQEAAMGYALKRMPKVGDSFTYKLTVAADFGGQSVNFTGTTIEKIIKVEDNGNYHVESVEKNMKVKFADQEMEIPEQPASTSIYKANGALIEMKGEQVDSNSYRLANMSTLIAPEKPVKVGDKWTQETKADAKTGLAAAKADYEVLGAEKVGSYDTVKLKFSYKETEGSEPSSSEGTVWINVKDGSLVKADATVKNAPLPGAPGPADMKFTIERTA